MKIRQLVSIISVWILKRGVTEGRKHMVTTGRSHKVDPKLVYSVNIRFTFSVDNLNNFYNFIRKQPQEEMLRALSL
jgi:hypothetical protein